MRLGWRVSPSGVFAAKLRGMARIPYTDSGVVCDAICNIIYSTLPISTCTDTIPSKIPSMIQILTPIAIVPPKTPYSPAQLTALHHVAALSTSKRASSFPPSSRSFFAFIRM